MTFIQLLRHAASSLFMSVTPSAATNDAPVSVGAGAPNEYQIHIDGIPHLFRDEGDHVVHFVAAFDRTIQHTAFGNKLLPEVVPRWNKVQTYRGPKDTPQSVAEAVVRSSKRPGTSSATTQEPGDKRRVAGLPSAAPRDPVSVKTEEPSGAAYTVGTLVEWGEMEFPNRKPGGKPTYRSFAVKLQTEAGIKTLQGEGLKDVLADASCKVGERVGIKRLRKEKVPAFDHQTGNPILDKKTGEQKLWDRWVWAINRIH
ncbi:hypothetical protein [Cupriavidus sp. D384]|uniref:hypothetical protein n=1 Tax=Cupriavidus sp. D384 TaxID=1538095 RepID=UPI0008337F42|nr:hypothetical protein [Cupriavidus sp. D384]